MAARYLPPDLYRRLCQVLPVDLPPELRGQIIDVVETAFGWGYVDGDDRGAEEGAWWVSTPLGGGPDRRVGAAQVRNGYAPHPSAPHPSAQSLGAQHRLDPSREPGTVTPMRMGRIGEIGDDIALDRLGTEQLDPAAAARRGPD